MGPSGDDAPGRRPVRAEQMATLRQIAHDLLTGAEIGDLLDRAEQDAAGLEEAWQAANLREMRRSLPARDRHARGPDRGLGARHDVPR